MPAVSPIVHARSAQVGIGERDSRRAWGQQLVVRGQLHSPMGKLVMRVAHVAPIRARCFNSKRTSFHVALELEHVESVDLRSAIRKADAVLPAFAREGQRGHTVKRVARRGRCRLLFLLGVQHIGGGVRNVQVTRSGARCSERSVYLASLAWDALSTNYSFSHVHSAGRGTAYSPATGECSCKSR